MSDEKKQAKDKARDINKESVRAFQIFDTLPEAQQHRLIQLGQARAEESLTRMVDAIKRATEASGASSGYALTLLKRVFGESGGKDPNDPVFKKTWDNALRLGITVVMHEQGMLAEDRPRVWVSPYSGAPRPIKGGELSPEGLAQVVQGLKSGPKVRTPNRIKLMEALGVLPQLAERRQDLAQEVANRLVDTGKAEGVVIVDDAGAVTGIVTKGRPDERLDLVKELLTKVPVTVEKKPEMGTPEWLDLTPAEKQSLTPEQSASFVKYLKQPSPFSGEERVIESGNKRELTDCPTCGGYGWVKGKDDRTFTCESCKGDQAVFLETQGGTQAIQRTGGEVT